jgi:gliding motility-associated-like protein
LQGCINPQSISPVAIINALDGVQSYAWTATGATPATSTLPNPSFSYTTQGNYPISVTITTNGGCQATATGTALIGTPAATPGFTITPNPVCGSDAVTFQSTGTPADHWDWTFGDGTAPPPDNQPNPTHSYGDIGTYRVFLTTFNNGCPSGSTNVVTVTGAIVGFTHKEVCPNPFSIQFTDTSHIDPASTPVTWLWDFGDGSPTSNATNPLHLYPNTGATPTPYTVTLTITTGACSPKTITVPITIGPTAVSFTSPPTACRYVDFTMTSTSTNPSLIASYSWQVGADPATPPSASPSYSTLIKTIGSYPITLTITDINGCTSSATNNITITGPIALFTSPGGCKNSAIPFNDQTTAYPGGGPPPAPPGPITSWSWDFGDGNTTAFTAPPFTHTYADTGTYTARLTVTDNAGCPDAYSLAVQITSPQAFFSGPDSFYCPNLPAPFRADSSQGYGLTYSWTFGDGSPVLTTTLPDTSHSYGTNGQTYTATLSVTDQVGCKATISHPVHIQKPIAAFTIADTTAICAPLQTMFTANGQFYDSLYWDFGDGTTSTLPTTSHFYNDYGTYTAKLLLQGPGGCLDSTSRQVFVANPFQAQFTYSPLKQCDSILVDFQIVPPLYTPFKLDFGDGSSDSTGNTTPMHLFKRPSRFTPQLIMYYYSGCIVGIGSGSGAITVLGATPFFSVDKDAFCDSGTVNFTDFTVTNDGIANETYSFGDGATASQTTPNFNATHFYSQAGFWPATLKVVTTDNCTESYADTIKVHQTPHPVISSTGSLCTGVIQFQGGLTVPDADTINWAWNFGNGQTSTQQDPSVTAAAGIYTVSLKTSISFGCSDTTSRSVTVNPLPVIKGPHEITTPVGFPVTIPFTYSENVVSYAWTPSAYLDCNTCANPAASPTFATEYTVTVTDANSCTSTDSILVKTICNGVNYFLPNTFSPNGDGVNDVFYPRGDNLYNIQSMRIFNRWGQMVFERKNFPANSSSDGWDGTFNGRPAQSDAYVYIVEVICNNGQIVALHGDVTLVR